jgi:hypothetical protein
MPRGNCCGRSLHGCHDSDPGSGAAANTAIFSVVEAVLLQLAGVDDPARVAAFHVRDVQLNLPSVGVSAPDLEDAASRTVYPV